MSWPILFLAGLFGTIWAIGLKYTHGFLRLWPNIGTLAAMAVSVWLLSLAMLTLPVGTVYAIWTGIGAVALGIILFGEPVTLARMACVGLIVPKLVGLKLVS